MQIFFGAIDSGRSNDESDPFGGGEFHQAAAEFTACVLVLDFSADADALESRHQHEISSRDTDVSGERRSLGSDTFLDDLNEDFAAAFEDFLDWGFVAAVPPVSAAWPPLGPLGGSGVPVGFASFGNQVFVVLVFDVTDVEESIASNAEIDKGGLNARFEIHDTAFVDVSYKVFQTVTFDIQFFQHPVLDDGYPTFLGLKNIDQHFFFHNTPFVWGDEWRVARIRCLRGLPVEHRGTQSKLVTILRSNNSASRAVENP